MGVDAKAGPTSSVNRAPSHMPCSATRNGSNTTRPASTPSEASPVSCDPPPLPFNPTPSLLSIPPDEGAAAGNCALSAAAADDDAAAAAAAAADDDDDDVGDDSFTLLAAAVDVGTADAPLAIWTSEEATFWPSSLRCGPASLAKPSRHVTASSAQATLRRASCTQKTHTQVVRYMYTFARFFKHPMLLSAQATLRCASCTQQTHTHTCCETDTLLPSPPDTLLPSARKPICAVQAVHNKHTRAYTH